MKATAQIFISPSFNAQTAFDEVKAVFQVTFDDQATFTAYYTNYDASVGSLSYMPDCCINGLVLVVADTEVYKDVERMEAIHSACVGAFYDHFTGLVKMSPVHGKSISECAGLSQEFTLSPRAESFLNNSYFVSIFCDEQARDGNEYLVSVTPYNSTPDAFDYEEVESVPFIESGWFSDYDKAREAYKKACVKYISKGLQ